MRTKQTFFSLVLFGLFFLVPLSFLSAQATFAISGKIQYTDKVYGTTGFTGATTLHEVRHLEVQLVRTSDNHPLDIEFTGEDGCYTFTVQNLQIGSAAQIEVFSRRVNASFPTVGDPANKKTGLNFAIQRLSDNAFYSAVTDPFILTGNMLDQSCGGSLGQTGKNVIIPLQSSAPFNISDTVTFGFQHLYEPTGADESANLPAIPPLLQIFWESGSSAQCGTCTTVDSNTGNNEMFLSGTVTDPDEWDDDIILHEFGHYVQRNFSRDNTPGGSHSITDHTDLRLSFSEGFAHYYSASVRQWVQLFFSATDRENRYPNYTYQIDNKFNGAYTAFEIEGPTPYVTGADNELAVAAVLWDILDPNNETGSTSFQDACGNSIVGQDTLGQNTGITYKTIMDIFVINIRFDDLIPSATILERFFDFATTPVGAERVAPQAAIQQILHLVGIFYNSDCKEPDDAASNAVDLTASILPVTVGPLTFFPATRVSSSVPATVDQDIFKFRAQQGVVYNLETLNLQDGADTLLQLWDPNFVTLFCQNDDRVVGVDKSSQILWQAPTTDNFYVVARPYDGTDMVNTYGNYSMRISVFTGTVQSVNSFGCTQASALPSQAPSAGASGGGGGGGCYTIPIPEGKGRKGGGAIDVCWFLLLLYVSFCYVLTLSGWSSCSLCLCGLTRSPIHHGDAEDTTHLTG